MTKEKSIATFRLAFEILFGRTVGYIELRAIHQTTGTVVRKWLLYDKSEKMYEDIYSLTVSLDGYNFYVGRALRRDSSGGSGDSIDYISSFSFDIDPIRPKGLPSDLAEWRFSEQTCRKLRDHISRAGTIVTTGNGCQLWVPTAQPLDVRGRRKFTESVLRDLFDKSQALVLESGYKTYIQNDPQWDLARIVKLPGTKSVKGLAGPDRPHRYAEILEDGTDHLKKFDLDLYINMIGADKWASEPAKTKIVAASIIPGRFWVLLADDLVLQDSWYGKRVDITDTTGSGQDCALVHRLKYHRFSPEEAGAIMKQAPGGKARYSDSYANTTISKVYHGT